MESIATHGTVDARRIYKIERIPYELLHGRSYQSDSRFAKQHPLHILVAYDNYINRRLLLLMLANLGYKADACENGRECFRAVLEKDSYDLVLSDIDMPEMSGIECALALRQAGQGVPIIAVTASSPDTVQTECFEAGMSGFMRKPISTTELKRALREVSLRKWVNEVNHAVVAHA
jgi:CheY-like chemotaxis protein